MVAAGMTADETGDLARAVELYTAGLSQMERGLAFDCSPDTPEVYRMFVFAFGYKFKQLIAHSKL